MSAPPAGSAGGSPEPNWYPDPSIPGYIRYWSGTSWMPGTSRPEPREGEPVPGPPEMPPGLSAPAATASSTPPASPAAAPAVTPPAHPEPAPRPDETGPLYFDEDPPESRGTDQVQKSGEQEAPRQPAPSGPGALPELRSRSRDDVPAWTPDEDVSTSPVTAVRRKGPSGGTADPRMPFSRGPEPGGAAVTPQEQTIGIRRVDLEADLRRRGEEAGERPAAAAASPASASAPAERDAEEAPQSSWTKQVQELANRETEDGVPPVPVQGTPIPPQQSAPPQLAHPSPAHPLPGTTVPSQPVVPHEAAPQGLPQPAHASPAHPLPGARQSGYAAPPQPAHASPVQPFTGQHGTPQQAHPTVSGVLGAPQMTPLTEAGLVVPTETPWGGATAQAYPAGLGRRLLARLIDTLVPLGAAAALALPLLDRARDHIDDKITAAEHAGVNTTVWLVDSTTGVYLALVLGVFLLAGLLLEALPTALWGKSAGKAALGLRVLDMSSQERPGVGAALSRWLMYSVLGLLLIGIVNVLWCLWDRPWRQCLHDKAAGTFVAAPPRS